MTGCAQLGLERCRYGDSALWTVREAIAGSLARRLAERVDLFFEAGEASLLLDLRPARLVDDAGAAALARCRGAHPGFRTVGRPAIWRDLPLGVRVALQGLDPADDLESALAPTVRAAETPADAPHRRHPRIPLRLPVHLVLGDDDTAPATLCDISRGGLRVAQVPDAWLGALGGARAARPLAIIGLDADPLGRELTRGFGHRPVPAIPVHVHPGNGLGARFPEAAPPV